ncbi:MAG TPA: hypothetical protein VJN94_04005 [Candidatus Binataceae bacterium]|nr:hypothetical protein [Candidatus Binataceae bacterium]
MNIPRTLVFVLALFLVTGYSAAAFAMNWYLIAPDQKDMSNPMVSTRMHSGPVVGPLDGATQGRYESRPQCESGRRELIEGWRKASVIKRGGWDRFGLRSPSDFIRCVPANDPQLHRTAGNPTAPTLEMYVNVKNRLR